MDGVSLGLRCWNTAAAVNLNGILRMFLEEGIIIDLKPRLQPLQSGGGRESVCSEEGYMGRDEFFQGSLVN